MGKPRGHLFVLAGTNGTGKSSIGGAQIRAAGQNYFNPDEATRQFMVANPSMSLDQANAAAWAEGKRRLEAAIRDRSNYAFETTLGGNTIASLLAKASKAGKAVHVWYCGLASAELHVARVAARVATGGHDIPEGKIRERYDSSRANLVDLVPHLAELYVYDNSAEADPHIGAAPEPVLLLHLKDGKIVYLFKGDQVPEWAKPILMAALKAVG